MTNRWDEYFLNICNSVASNSRCLSRKIGAIIVRDNSIISTGYNGPPRGIPHCGEERWRSDKFLQREFGGIVPPRRKDLDSVCPRRLLSFESGEGLHLCIATHAEQNCIADAARFGKILLNTTIYVNTVIPCKDCMKLLINVGIKKIVAVSDNLYDEQTRFLIEAGGVEIRKFYL